MNVRNLYDMFCHINCSMVLLRALGPLKSASVLSVLNAAGAEERPDHRRQGKFDSLADPYYPESSHGRWPAPALRSFHGPADERQERGG